MSKERDDLIIKWMGLAVWYAKHHFTGDTRYDFEERRSVAYEALIKAADGYDPAMGFSFGTYAGKVIYRMLSKEAYKQATQVKRPSLGAKRVVEEMKQQSLGTFVENRHSHSEEKSIEDRDHVEWILNQLDEQERAVAIGLMEGRKYAEIILPTTRGYSNNGSIRSRAAYVKKKITKVVSQREFELLLEYIQRQGVEYDADLLPHSEDEAET